MKETRQKKEKTQQDPSSDGSRGDAAFDEARLSLVAFAVTELHDFKVR
jgi:hypothetical protein